MYSDRKQRIMKLLANQDKLFAELGFKRCKFKYEYNGFQGDVCFKGADRAFYRIDHFPYGYVIEYAENEADARKNRFWDADLFDDSLPEEEILAQLKAALLKYVIQGIEEQEQKITKILDHQDQFFEELGFERHDNLSHKGPDGFFYLIGHYPSEYKFVIAYAENEDDANRHIFSTADLFDDDPPEEEIIKQLKSALLEYVAQNRDENNSERHPCPVCGKHEFEEYCSYDFCPVCKWHDDALLTVYPDDVRGYYHMTLNEAREAYKNGQEIY